MKTIFAILLLFLLAGIVQVYLILRRKDTSEPHQNKDAFDFKLRAEEIIVMFDHSEFKESLYTHEVEDERLKQLALLGGGASQLLDGVTREERIIQSVLIYNNGKERFVSQVFPFDKTTLKFYVLNGHVVIYVDRFDRSQYFFEIKEHS